MNETLLTLTSDWTQSVCPPQAIGITTSHRPFYNQHAPIGVNPIIHQLTPMMLAPELQPIHSSRERVLQVCAHNKAIPSW